jgi:hypothetical protein
LISRLPRCRPTQNRRDSANRRRGNATNPRRTVDTPDRRQHGWKGMQTETLTETAIDLSRCADVLVGTTMDPCHRSHPCLGVQHPAVRRQHDHRSSRCRVALDGGRDSRDGIDADRTPTSRKERSSYGPDLAPAPVPFLSLLGRRCCRAGSSPCCFGRRWDSVPC